MRLTLRTLLAYLDNTLDADSSATLRSKIAESGFATKLVQRIKATLASPLIGSPSPDAAGPVEEANLIGEYLDSTLPVEQVAEIERACLESDALLAESAACHQILTLVLGKPAEVSPSLRERVYDLPNTDAAKLVTEHAAPESFASLSIPDQPTLDLNAPTVIPQKPSDAGVLQPPRGQPVKPVGPSDSGVSDAPKRLRQEEEAARAGTAGGTAIAGSKPRPRGMSDLYAGSIRTSRITPWLVSLALAGVLLFALAQIFAPLLNRQVAMQEDDSLEYIDSVPPDKNEPLSASQLADANGNAVAPEIEAPPESTPPMQPVGEPVKGADAKSDQQSPSRTTPPPVNGTPAVTESDTLPPPLVGADDEREPAGSLAPVTEVPTNDPQMTEPSMTQAGATEPTASEAATTEPKSTGPGDTVAEIPGPARDSNVVPPSGDDLKKPDQPMPQQPAIAEVNPSGDAVAGTDGNDGIAKLVTDRTLVAAKSGQGSWALVSPGASIAANTEILCAPSFRARLETTDGLNLTMAGPTRLAFIQNEADYAIYLEGGRVLLRHKTPGAVVTLSLAGRVVAITLGSADSLVAIHLDHRRQPGADPLVVTSRVRTATLMIVQGVAELTSANMTNQLDTGQQWQLVGDSEPVQTVAKEIEEWIDEPDPNEASLEALARSGLLSMIGGEQSLELSLRESIPFRRAEVGALASRTLLWLGFGDVYFGNDGMLNQPRQKVYWDDHYQSLLSVVNESVRSAQQVRDAIGRMEAAEREKLFGLLVGYTQEQLKGGADAKLVEMLDSPSMAVRVLALQNLRQITGTTLNFRADQDNAIRRSADVKKWEARARKGDIRWPENVDETIK